MKKFGLFVMLAVLTIGFSSCGDNLKESSYIVGESIEVTFTDFMPGATYNKQGPLEKTWIFAGTNADYNTVRTSFQSGLKTISTKYPDRRVIIDFYNVESMTSMTYGLFKTYYTCIEGYVGPADLTAANAHAFYQCENLQYAIFPGATSVSYCTFYECTLIEELIFPKVTSVDYDAFYGCTSLKTLRFLSDSAITFKASVESSEFSFSGLDTKEITLYLSQTNYDQASGNYWKGYEWKKIDVDNTDYATYYDDMYLKVTE